MSVLCLIFVSCLSSAVVITAFSNCFYSFEESCSHCLSHARIMEQLALT